jgi:hypothetical protein
MSPTTLSDPPRPDETYSLEQLSEMADVPIRTIRYYISAGWSAARKAKRRARTTPVASGTTAADPQMGRRRHVARSRRRSCFMARLLLPLTPASSGPQPLIVAR